MAEKSSNGRAQRSERRHATSKASARKAPAADGAKGAAPRPKGTTGTLASTGRVRQTTGTGRRPVQSRAGAQRKRVAKADINANFGGAGVQTRKQVREKARQQQSAPARHARSNRRVSPLLIGGIVLGLALVVVAVVVLVVPRLTSGGQSAQNGTQTNVSAVQGSAASVSFCAVGANIANADILSIADSWAGTTGDGEYDFSPLYERMSGVIAPYDISFICQGSTLGGRGSFEYQGFPSYNTPDSMADAIAGAGFDVVNTNTNHTLDMWVNAVEHSQSIWAQHPEVTTVGSYSSESDRKNIRVLEQNGMSIAFLSYCYGQNGYKASELPNDYYVTLFDKDTMRAEIAQAKELADAVVVYMHWNEQDEESGSTDTSVLSDQQQDYASFLAGQGVDLVIGCRGQAIQPVRYVGRGIRTTDGSGVTAENGMPCVYGLGDFVSAYTLPSAVLSGMFTCDFVRDANGEVSVQNPTWHGLIEHRSGSTDYVCPLSDYTSELASSNELLARLREQNPTATDPLQWARDTTRQTVGDQIAVEV